MITSQPITNDRWQRSERYINREHSWLEFNQRVLEEAENPANPTLERLKFLAIFESNLDEFFMVRVSGLMEQVDAGITTLTPDGLTPSEQVEMIAEEVLPPSTRRRIMGEVPQRRAGKVKYSHQDLGLSDRHPKEEPSRSLCKANFPDCDAIDFVSESERSVREQPFFEPRCDA